MASAEIMLPVGPIKAPAMGRTQKVPLGKAAHPSSSANPLLRSPRTRWATANSRAPTAASTKGATIWRNPVNRQAENSPTRAAVATSWMRR